MKNGKWTEEIGDMRTQGEYRNDKQVGEWVSYYDNDKLAFKGTFKTEDCVKSRNMPLA